MIPTANERLTAPLLLDSDVRVQLWQKLGQIIEEYVTGVDQRRVSTPVTPEEVRAGLAQFEFAKPLAPLEALLATADGLSRTQVHTPHPRYFGLFNPAPTTMGILADAIVAAFNPQLAAWKHSPFASEIERHVIRALGEKLGYAPERVDGTFASGGSEANHTALLAALTNAFHEFAAGGARALAGQPVFYVGSEGHHSFQKAARLCGIGSGVVREVRVDQELRMDWRGLEAAIAADRRAGLLPFMVVATLGTTNAGAIDPLPQIGVIARQERLWYHVDAAWGGAAALVPELRPHIQGAERADSITVDAHKWLSAPMGAGIFLTRHPEILARTFHISAAYVPPKAEGVADPLEHSIQWSRRFIGLKVFLSLAVAGWEGYAAVLRQMVRTGDTLRSLLSEAGWEVANATPLPIVCFRDGSASASNSAEYLEAIASAVVESGDAWISTTRIGTEHRPVLRACITNYRTNEKDLRILIAALERAREKAPKPASRDGE